MLDSTRLIGYIKNMNHPDDDEPLTDEERAELDSIAEWAESYLEYDILLAEIYNLSWYASFNLTGVN